MADHYLKGLNGFRSYRTTLNINVPDERIAAALRIPIIQLKQNSASFQKRISETVFNDVALVFDGATVGNMRTNTGAVVAP